MSQHEHRGTGIWISLSGVMRICEDRAQTWFTSNNCKMFEFLIAAHFLAPYTRIHVNAVCHLSIFA